MPFPESDERNAGVFENGFDVREIQVDHRGEQNEFDNRLYRFRECFVTVALQQQKKRPYSL